MQGKHWYTFKRGGISELNKSSWEALRNDANERGFFVEEQIEEYEINCERKKDYNLAAEEMLKFFDKNNLNKIVSRGVGKGILEWHLKKKCPSIQITCTDYTEMALEKLRRVFPQAEEFNVFDMLEGEWRKLFLK